MRATAKDLPVIVTCDFNITPTDSTIAVLTSLLTDSYYLLSAGHYGPEGTWNGFDYNSLLSDSIDYCFIDSSRVEIFKHAHLDDAYQQRFPSDHLPVFVVLRIKSSNYLPMQNFEKIYPNTSSFDISPVISPRLSMA